MREHALHDYGNTLIFDAQGTGASWWANDASQTKVATCEALFTGQRYDAESEIYLYRFRMYAPKLGRWLSLDPAGVDGLCWNLSEFVGSRPQGNMDPLGLGLGMAGFGGAGAYGPHAAAFAAGYGVGWGINRVFIEPFQLWDRLFDSQKFEDIDWANRLRVDPSGGTVILVRTL